MKFLIAIITITILSLTIFPQKAAKSTSYTATAYCLSGRTSSGQRVRTGIVAADLRLLPIGSKLYIQNLGFFTVADSGSAIRGRKLDLWMPSCNNAVAFGRRTVQVKQIA